MGRKTVFIPGKRGRFRSGAGARASKQYNREPSWPVVTADEKKQEMKPRLVRWLVHTRLEAAP